jgi:hypothetical protein
LIARYVKALESSAGRLSLAEQHGRTRALREIAAGAFEATDGEVVELRPYGITDESELPTVLDTTTPRRRGFLRASLAAERAHALLQAPPPPAAPLATAAGLLGERRTRDLFDEAIRWPGVRSVYCAQHGVTPCAPGSEGERCYLGCTIPTTGSGPEVA